MNEGVTLACGEALIRGTADSAVVPKDSLPVGG